MSRTSRMGLVLGLIGSLLVTPSAMAGANTREEQLRMRAEAKQKLKIVRDEIDRLGEVRDVQFALLDDLKIKLEITGDLSILKEIRRTLERVASLTRAIESLEAEADQLVEFIASIERQLKDIKTGSTPGIG